MVAKEVSKEKMVGSVENECKIWTEAFTPSVATGFQGNLCCVSEYILQCVFFSFPFPSEVKSSSAILYSIAWSRVSRLRGGKKGQPVKLNFR